MRIAFAAALWLRRKALMDDRETPTVTQTSIPALPVRRGKVRDIYDLGGELLLIATDRISAYDVVLPTPIPGKGALLTRMSQFWFRLLKDHVPHHLIEVIEDEAPAGLEAHVSLLRGRAMRCRKCDVVPIECVVRGYLAGSGWQEYQRMRGVCGVPLPAGLQQCDRLPSPIFTPATKAEHGHDENIAFEESCEIAGTQCMTLLRDRSLRIYDIAAEHARQRGIIIADTKFEWGRLGDEYLLIDEVLTPDSSRFWPAEDYQPGRDQKSFDKQYVRDFLTGLCDQGRWDKTPPGPELPDEIVRNTTARYHEALARLTR
jgi:phosphoribosylaminoimidazole-succinocarboxamide synthase